MTDEPIGNENELDPITGAPLHVISGSEKLFVMVVERMYWTSHTRNETIAVLMLMGYVDAVSASASQLLALNRRVCELTSAIDQTRILTRQIDAKLKKEGD